jgi:signal transduction histidine kinase
MADVAPGRVLVVDDNDSARFWRTRLLRAAGHTVFEASNIAQAEVLVREYRPELIVLDVQLPDGSGLDLCRRIKQDDDLRVVMVLQMSATFVTDDDHVKGLEAGADAYLTDPTSPGVFVATAAALLRLSRAERAIKEMLALEQQARSEAESANRLKDDFLATLSHELRTPLNAIVGWTTLMRTMNMDEDARRHAIEIIERNAKAQAALIEDLLDVSRIAQGQLQLSWLSVQIPVIVAAAIDTIRPSAEAKGLTISPSMAVDPRMVVRGDPVRLQQVVWNLLSNAVKFTPAGGQITVAINLDRDDSHIEIRVADSGRGIKPEFLPNMFERFRRADSGPTSAEGGLGLGLSIARQLVEMHGGTLTAISPGEHQGSTFIVRLPRIAAGPPFSRRPAVPAAVHAAKENASR